MSQRTDREIMHEPKCTPCDIAFFILVILLIAIIVMASGCGVIDTYHEITRS